MWNKKKIIILFMKISCLMKKITFVENNLVKNVYEKKLYKIKVSKCDLKSRKC